MSCDAVMDGLCGCLNVRTRLSVASRRVTRSTLTLTLTATATATAIATLRVKALSIFYAMADFFNLKARQQAAAEASSAKAPSTKQQPDRLQPWVEK